jgi:hypothetical protein
VRLALFSWVVTKGTRKSIWDLWIPHGSDLQCGVLFSVKTLHGPWRLNGGEVSPIKPAQEPSPVNVPDPLIIHHKRLCSDVFYTSSHQINLAGILRSYKDKLNYGGWYHPRCKLNTVVMYS